MDIYDLAYLGVQQAVALFLLPAELIESNLSWLTSNLFGFGVGYDEEDHFFVAAYVGAVIPDDILNIIRLALPAMLIKPMVIRPFQALAGPASAGPGAGPLHIGAQISKNGAGQVGTLCTFVNTAVTGLSFLSCQHVLPGGPPTQAFERQNGATGRLVGTVFASAVLTPVGVGTPPNKGDWVVATLAPGVSIDTSLPSSMGPLSSSLADPTQLMQVDKADGLPPSVGGTVVGSGATVKVQYHNGTFNFSDQILIQPNSGNGFSQDGDSGALVVDRSQPKRALAMVFAGGLPGGTGEDQISLTAALPLKPLFAAQHLTLRV